MKHTFALLAMLALAATPAAHGADAGRAPCTLSTDDDMPSDTPDGRAIAFEARKPVGLVDWSVRWHQRQRLWITITTTNRGDAPATLRTELATDLQPDGARVLTLLAPPRVVGPHASAAQRVALYVPADATALAVLLRAAEPGASVAATLAVECSDRRFDPGEMAPPAAALLDEALRAYATEFADPIANAARVVETVRLQASGAQDATDVAWAMRYLMSSLGDGASYMLAPGEAPPPPAVPSPARPPAVALRDDGVATLRLATVAADTPEAQAAFAARLREAVARVLARRPRGWVIDLRDDGGGDMWAPLAALGSLLQGPVVGAFVGHEGRQQWLVERGSARVAGAKPDVDLQLAPEPPFTGPIAVLVGPGTEAAGEALAIAFRGRPRTRLFGAPTRGRDDSAIVQHPLAGGSVLGVLALRAADRTGAVVRGPLVPDVPAAGQPDTPIPGEALDWLRDAR